MSDPGNPSATSDPTAASGAAADSDDAKPARPWGVWRRGAVAGLVATAVALGVAELVRALNRQLSSPVIDVGARFIDATPRWLKDFAISTFGTNDKTALIVGIAIVLAIYAVVIGVAGTRRRWMGPAGVALFAVIGIVASVAQSAPWWAGLPSLVGGIAGAAALWFLLGLAVEPQGGSTKQATASEPEDGSAHGTGEGVGAGTGEPAVATAPAIAGLTDADHAAPGVLTDADRAAARVPAGLGRRSFLVASAGLGAAALVAGATGRWLSGRFDVAAARAKIMLPKALRPLPKAPAGVDLGIPGLTPFVTDNSKFYRIDTALVAPQVPVETWSLTIKGMVDKTLEFSYDELLDRDLVESDITLSCVSNEVGGILAGNARWLGVPLSQLMEEAGVKSGADQIVGRSVDGFTAGFPVEFGLEADRGAILAVGMNGEPLPVIHGFPARLIVPGLYGFVSATKWLTEIELTTFDKFDAYWVERDWSADGTIKTFSRIDTPKPLKKLDAGTHPIAGIAWAQTRGISKVEVRVDGGEWMETELSEELNDVTWRQWMLPFDFTESGQHSIECRATDGTGAVQTEERTRPFPNGASGWHSVVALVS